MAAHRYMEVKQLVKVYDTGKVKANAVDHVSFYVDQGEFIGIMGASGSGKNRGQHFAYGSFVCSLFCGCHALEQENVFPYGNNPFAQLG